MNVESRLTDWHCHLLPGLDDGPATEAESLAMARALAAAGFSRICCTPHAIRGVYDNRPAEIREATSRLQQRLTEEEIELCLLPGMECCLDEFLLDNPDDLLLLPGSLLLVEIPQHSQKQVVVETLYHLLRRNITPLIAHPERCELLALPHEPDTGVTGRVGKFFKLPFTTHHAQADGSSSLLAELRLMGCNFQGNLGSLAGFYGERVRRKAEKFQAAGIYTHFGSDLHSAKQTHILTVSYRQPACR